jgi:hypothetical protein
MQISAFGDNQILAEWSELGKPYEQSFDDFVDDKDELKAKARSVCADAQNDEEKIAAIYDFVRDNIDTDKSTKHTAKISEILEQKSASPDDKNVLLAAMLQCLDYDAHPLLIATRDHAKFNPEVRHILQLNHVVCHVTVDSNTFVLDAKDHSVVFPYLPPNDLIYGGVLLDGEDSRAVSFEPRMRNSGKAINSKIIINDDGSAVCSTCICLR